MAETWPPQLQPRLNARDWRYLSADTNITTEMDTGPKKVRRRFTRPDRTLTGRIWFHRDDYQAWDDFVTITLANYTRAFNYDHPITTAPTTFRFTKPAEITHLGGEHFIADMEWLEVVN